MYIDPFSPTDPLCGLPKSQLPFFQWLRCRSQAASPSTSAEPFELLDTGVVSPNSSKPTVRLPKFTPQNWRQSLFWGVISALFAAMPVQAAERIVFAYGQLEFYLPVSSLETFARDGNVDKYLEYYFRFLTPEVQSEVRKALQASSQEKPLPVSQILYSPMGEAALRDLGELIQTGPEQNGFYALRAAAIQSAAHPEGLSLMGFLRHFPTSNI